MICRAGPKLFGACLTMLLLSMQNGSANAQSEPPAAGTLLPITEAEAISLSTRIATAGLYCPRPISGVYIGESVRGRETKLLCRSTDDSKEWFIRILTAPLTLPRFEPW